MQTIFSHAPFLAFELRDNWHGILLDRVFEISFFFFWKKKFLPAFLNSVMEMLHACFFAILNEILNGLWIYESRMRSFS